MSPVLAVVILIWTGLALAQYRVIPRSELVLGGTEQMGDFTIERWDRAGEKLSAPFVKAHWYRDAAVRLRDKEILSLPDNNFDSDGERFRIDEHSGTDITGDGISDLIIHDFTGGAHCCSTTLMYSISEPAKLFFKVEMGNCSGELRDLNGDGVFEFVTCDDAFAYAFCAYAFSAKPLVVYRYDPAQKTYIPDTPRFDRYFSDRLQSSIERAAAEVSKPDDKREISDRCAVHGAVLETLYLTGSFERAAEVLQRLYKEPDRTEFQNILFDEVKGSPHFSAR